MKLDLPPDKQALFAKWLDALETRDYPATRLLWGRPLYAQETITERIEPFATQYDEVSDQLPWFEDGPPDPEFYTPTKRLRRLWNKLDTLKPLAFRQIPNPDYDPIRAMEWKANRRKPFDQVKIQVGQSYNPPPPE
jgi:hypothetical protein